MRILFRGGKVFDGLTESVDGLGVLVEDGRITAVSAIDQFSGFDGEVVDTAGGTLLPSLIDCHVHLCLGGDQDPLAARAGMSDGRLVMAALKRAQDTLAGGVTAIRDCGGKNHLEFAVRDACNSGEQFGPTIRAAGRMVCMTGGHGNVIARVADGPDDVVKAVREQIHAGSDFLKIMATGGVLTPGVDPEDAHYTYEELKAGIGEAHRFRRPAASHAQGTAGILNATRAGVDSIEHGIFMTEECVQEMVSRGTFLVPTLSAGHRIEQDDELVAGLPDHVQAKLARIRGRGARSLKLFYDAGGKVAMGTDAGVPYCRHGDNALEVELMVDAGLTPVDSLIAATSNAAELMRLDDAGRITEGAVADLLVVDGDPTADITMASRPSNHRAVFRRGVPVAS